MALFVSFAYFNGNTGCEVSGPQPAMLLAYAFHAWRIDIGNSHRHRIRVSSWGDGVLVYFGYPQAHEDALARLRALRSDLIDPTTVVY
jgi:hypothetical protein